MSLNTLLRSGAVILAALLMIRCSSSSPSTPPPSSAPPVSGFLTGVSSADGTPASLQAGSPPAANGGPSAAVSGTATVTSGGSDTVQVQSTSAFQGVLVSVSNTSGSSRIAPLEVSAPSSIGTLAAADGFYRLNLPAATTSVLLVETFGTALPAGTFTVAYAVVSAAGLVGPTVTATKTVSTQPPPSTTTLFSLTLASASVVGGNSVQGTVVLTGAAPAGGASVTLSSNDTNFVLSLPSTVTVAAGATSATFTVSTRAVGGSFPITISASFGGVTRTANVQVNPVQITQCTFTLNSTSSGASAETGVPAAGGSFGVNIGVSPATCSWRLTPLTSSPSGMIAINSGASGTGNGSAGYTVSPNSGAARTGGLQVQSTSSGTTGSAQFTVSQLPSINVQAAPPAADGGADLR
jgi:hypothetical protein